MAEDSRRRSTYLIVRPENGGIRDLALFLVGDDGAVFVETSAEDGDGGVKEAMQPQPPQPDHRWVIIVSIIIRKILAFFRKPMEWTGYLLEFILNLISLNGGLFGLFFNSILGKVAVPKRGSENFISAIGHLDGRIDLYSKNMKSSDKVEEKGSQFQVRNRALMDLCIMASKLAYENANVVKNVVQLHWKMHFVDFYNCWNDYQKERSTQVFILSNKPKDADLVLVSFRGTEPFDADDWSTDFDYSWFEIPELGKVHMGFLEALGLGNRSDPSTFLQLLHCDMNVTNGNETDHKRRLEVAADAAYLLVSDKLKSLLKEHGKAKFVVTGHSLGGALAILYPTLLVLQKEEELMERMLGIYTFGQPRIGDSRLGKFMQAHIEHPVPKYFRVVYCNDLVPRLPYDDKTFLYKHFGFCLYYNSLYVDRKMNEEPNRNYFGIRYLIPEYINAGWELIRGFGMGYVYGADYKESWLSILFRIMGLALPGISDHSPVDYVNSVRLGRTTH